MEQNADLRQLSYKNHVNDWCTKYMEPEILGRFMKWVPGTLVSEEIA